MKKIKVIKEFRKAHIKYSLENIGRWKRGWEKRLKYADLQDGHWYWKNYHIFDLLCQKRNIK